MDTSSEDGTITRRRPRFRNLKVWKYFCDYFPIHLHKSTDLDPERTYVFGPNSLLTWADVRVPSSRVRVHGCIREFWNRGDGVV